MYALLCLGAGSMGLLGLLLGAINSRKWDTIEEFESEIPLLYFLIIPPLIYIVISHFDFFWKD